MSNKSHFFFLLFPRKEARGALTIGQLMHERFGELDAIAEARASGEPTLMGVAFFLFDNGYWSNLVIPFTDLSQVFIAWFFYRWANQIAEVEGRS